jgi:tripartite-type tricarboxylate transporter receptor subunit TctC
MTPYQKTFAAFSTVLAVVAITAATAAPAQYPQRPITILAGYDTGSVGDQIARGLAEAARTHLAQPILVINRPGASGTLAISEALAARPDGYTLGLGTIGNLTVQPHRVALPYGGPDTYVPVAKLVSYPNVLIVKAGTPWKTAHDFLTYARAHPGAVSVGVPGQATVAHLNVEQLNRLANVRLKAVYFDGPRQVAAALLGEIDAAVVGPGPVMSNLATGEAVALGVFGEERLPMARNVPTFKELGFDITLGSAQGIVAPLRTPPAVIDALDGAIRKAIAEPSFVSLARETQNTIDYKDPAAFAAELRESFGKNGELLRALGLTNK